MNTIIIGIALLGLVAYIVKRAYYKPLMQLVEEARAISKDPTREAPDANEAFNKVIDEIKKEQNNDE